ncbi:VonWillebr and factor type A domain-containing protein [Haloferula helveola]|uniref:vonWillebr and factor type A domain-containing protein n=1 Tax=Haloferula helveola TaxID=490095 RepID=A0ABM7RG95_9BACT|nr:VonWillebr and factor type A domain-containing protein [Haloferula helveola]
MKIAAVFVLSSGFWLTADQQGQRAFDGGRFDAAAENFEDPMWKGAAYYRAGEFKSAQAAFARLDTAEAHYNRGNCLIFLGQYDDAMASYDRALARVPGWQEARDNRNIALARAERMQQEGGEMGDQQIGADEIVFDKKKSGGEDTSVAGEQATDSASMQAMWLRRVQTEPADFLKAKFAYQIRFEEEVGP